MSLSAHACRQCGGTAFHLKRLLTMEQFITVVWDDDRQTYTTEGQELGRVVTRHPLSEVACASCHTVFRYPAGAGPHWN